MEQLVLRQFSIVKKEKSSSFQAIDAIWKRSSSVALYGPSGTGRTSWLLALGGLMAPTHGEVLLEGKGGTRPPKARDIGIGPIRDLIPLFPTLTIEEHIKMQIRLFRAGSIQKRTDQLLQDWQLSHVSHQRVKDVDRHLQTRVGIAVAIAHHPYILLLDDPEEGMTGSEWRHPWGDLMREIQQHSLLLITTTMRDDTVSNCDYMLDFSQTTEAFQ
ncbi:ABC-2 type transport system ATP-binding protein [Marininema mesophilum]|uniref:ABC-2 type transport system ATP-binding protein n=1 Tax=Marininema mesophilum TaxID=1048340 RepID=A0A1H2Q2D9_9BACL|nr:ATP-binding cassette domain-containing protein [Marininema mesophilum]SDW00854.1 ABC-2 type transport system ATP-binding protein [Marininema mesophilum]